MLEELSLLQEKGSRILACGTCLDYGVEKLAAGQISILRHRQLLSRLRTIAL